MSNEPVIVLSKMSLKGSISDSVKESLANLIATTRAEEGNISYTAHIPLDNDNKIYFHEVWKTKTALDEHLQKPHLTGFLEVVTPFLDGESELSLWRALD